MNPLEEPSMIGTVLQTVLGYVLPFAGFCFGIYARFKLRDRFFPGDKLTPGELAILGVIFSLITVAPLLPSFTGFAHPNLVHSYLMTLAVVMQGGMFMPESVSQLISKKNRTDPGK